MLQAAFRSKTSQIAVRRRFLPQHTIDDAAQEASPNTLVDVRSMSNNRPTPMTCKCLVHMWTGGSGTLKLERVADHHLYFHALFRGCRVDPDHDALGPGPDPDAETPLHVLMQFAKIP